MFAKAIIAALVSLPFFVQAQASSNCTRTYTVVAGDICDSISAAQSVSTYQLASLNTEVDAACHDLQPGLQICLGGDPSEDCKSVHVVKSGDTCDSISAAYNTNSTILMQNNPQLDQSCDIYQGEVLCVANMVQAPVAQSSVISALQTDPSGLPYCDEL